MPKKINLKFHTSLYSKGAIVKALEAYKEIAKGNVEESNSNFIVELTPYKEFNQKEEEMIKSEFCNFALSMEK